MDCRSPAGNANFYLFLFRFIYFDFGWLRCLVLFQNVKLVGDTIFRGPLDCLINFWWTSVLMCSRPLQHKLIRSLGLIGPQRSSKDASCLRRLTIELAIQTKSHSLDKNTSLDKSQRAQVQQAGLDQVLYEVVFLSERECPSAKITCTVTNLHSREAASIVTPLC